MACDGVCGAFVCSRLSSVVLPLTYTRSIKGFRFGFDGLNSKTGTFMLLDPAIVRDIHTFGGSILGCSRGPQDVTDMVTTLVREHVSVLFTIGGDGTLKGAHAMSEEVLRRGLDIAIMGVPKTIDNDVPLMEKTFGFATAVSRGVEVRAFMCVCGIICICKWDFVLIRRFAIPGHSQCTL